MRNLIKKYFLFISDWPFYFSIVIAIISIISLAVFNFFAGEETFNLILHKYGLIFILVFFVHTFLVYFIRNKYITIIEDDDASYNTLFFVLVTKERKRMILTKPVWEKGKKYSITANRNYLSVSMLSCGADGNTETHCSINGKYKNSLVSVPVILKLKYDGVVDRMELFSLLFKNIPKSKDINTQELSLDEYLEIVFKKVNEANQAKFDEIISRYAQLTISDAEFLSEILDVVEFPERIFPYVTDTKICLGNPGTSACKGVTCETR